MPIGLNHITPGSIPAFTPQQYRSEVRMARSANFVMKNVCRELPIAGEPGNVHYIPNLSNLVASVKVPGAPVNFLRPNEGQFQLVIDKHVECSLLIEDITEVFAKQRLRSLYSAQQGKAVAMAFDDQLLGMRSSITGSILSGSVGMTEAKILAAKEALDIVDAPDDDRVIVVPPAVENDIISINRFVSADYLGGAQSKISSGRFVGRIHGFEVFKTSRIKAADSGKPDVGGGTASTYYSLALQKDALLYGIPSPSRVQSDYNLEYLGTMVVADEIFGSGVYRQDHALTILSL